MSVPSTNSQKGGGHGKGVSTYPCHASLTYINQCILPLFLSLHYYSTLFPSATGGLPVIPAPLHSPCKFLILHSFQTLSSLSGNQMQR